MLILEISYLHALCYNIYVIFIVVIIRPLGPRFIVSHRASGFAGTALASTAEAHHERPHLHAVGAASDAHRRAAPSRSTA